MKNRKSRWLFKILLVLFCLVASGIAAYFLAGYYLNLLGDQDHSHYRTFWLLYWLIGFATLTALSFSGSRSRVKMLRVTPSIEIPCPSGNNQYGSAHFSTPNEKKVLFRECKIKEDMLFKKLVEAGKNDAKNARRGEVKDPTPLCDLQIDVAGIPVGYQRKFGREYIKEIVGDVHAVGIGATRSGKTRNIVLQSICLQALAAKNMVNADPKGELYLYSSPFLRRLNYETLALDFKTPSKSIKFNFLQEVIDNLKPDDFDVPKAIGACWRLVEGLVKEGKADSPIWPNGEKSLLAGAIMLVVYENSVVGLRNNHPEESVAMLNDRYHKTNKWFQNLTNVYHFIARSMKENPETERMILTEIMEKLSETHPARLLFATAESAPEETRGSFVASALATLRLFADPNIASITNETTPGIYAEGKKAIYIILPDAEKTYYPLASLFVNQYYQFLADKADRYGGRLPVETYFNLDEFGNFAKIPDFDAKMTVGAGRGIFFNLYLQSTEQLVLHYGREMAQLILDNCHYMLYLKSGSNATSQYVSTKTGTYTVKSTSHSDSQNERSSGGSSSSSDSLVSRPLLFPNEIERIERPYLLVLADGTASMMKTADLSRWKFNTCMGMGSKKHNIKLRICREEARPQHPIAELRLWDFQEHFCLNHFQINV